MELTDTTHLATKPFTKIELQKSSDLIAEWNFGDLIKNNH